MKRFALALGALVGAAVLSGCVYDDGYYRGGYRSAYNNGYYRNGTRYYGDSYRYRYNGRRYTRDGYDDYYYRR